MSIGGGVTEMCMQAVLYSSGENKNKDGIQKSQHHIPDSSCDDDPCRASFDRA